MEIPQNSISETNSPYLSVLPNAGEGSITYYTGDDPKCVRHLKGCKLYCNQGFEPGLDDVEIVHCDDPQLEFYRLSESFREDYLERDKLKFDPSSGAYIHTEAKIGSSVSIGPGSVIANATIEDHVQIGPNVTVFSKSVIQEGTEIEAGTIVGAAGTMWVWDGERRIFLEQLGNAVIGRECRIGSQIVISRGSANESTVLGEGTCIAHGTMIGHGCRIGRFVHLANGISLGGSVKIADYTFVGSGVTIRPRVEISVEEVVLGAGTVLTKDISSSGVYAGVPAKRIGNTRRDMSGIPMWNREQGGS